jgi:hypothetical protein
VTLLALAVFLLFSALVLPQQARQAEESSAGAGSPDRSFFYSPADLYAMRLVRPAAQCNLSSDPAYR